MGGRTRGGDRAHGCPAPAHLQGGASPRGYRVRGGRPPLLPAWLGATVFVLGLVWLGRAHGRVLRPAVAAVPAGSGGAGPTASLAHSGAGSPRLRSRGRACGAARLSRPSGDAGGGAPVPPPPRGYVSRDDGRGCRRSPATATEPIRPPPAATCAMHAACKKGGGAGRHVIRLAGLHVPGRCTCGGTVPAPATASYRAMAVRRATRWLPPCFCPCAARGAGGGFPAAPAGSFSLLFWTTCISSPCR